MTLKHMEGGMALVPKTSLTQGSEQLLGRADHPSMGKHSLAGADDKFEEILHSLHVHQLELETQNEELRHAMLELEISKESYAELYDPAPVGYCTVAASGLILQANLTLAQLLGVPRNALRLQRFSNYINREDQDVFYLLRKRLEDEAPVKTAALEADSCELRMVRQDGGPLWAQITASSATDASGPIMRLVVSDIAARKHAEKEIQLAASVFRHALEAIMITDAKANIIDVNHAFTQITGYKRDEVMGMNPHLLGSDQHGQDQYATMWQGLLDQGFWSGEIRSRHKNGSEFVEMLTISAIPDENGIVQNYVALFSDITERKEYEKELEHFAHFDALTNLPNRVLLADRLKQSMAQVQRRQQQLAVIYIDLDGFKAINDNFGHKAGDQVLILLANRMREALREIDTLARLGGDEFVAVLSDLEDTTVCPHMLDRLLNAAASPLQLEGQSLAVTASLGVTFYPQEEEITEDQLMRQADQAMYQAKLAGKNRYHFYQKAK